MWRQKEWCGEYILWEVWLLSTPMFNFIAFLEQAQLAEQFWCVNGMKIPNIKQ